MEPTKCPYCRRVAEFKTSLEHYGEDYGNNVYVCKPCDAYVGTYGRSRKPYGTLANGELRIERKNTHSVFDLMWQQGHMTRSEAYHWLSLKTGLPPQKTHIGMFNLRECKVVWLWALQFLLTNSELVDCPDCVGLGDVGFPNRMNDYRPCPRCRGQGMIQRGDIRIGK